MVFFSLRVCVPPVDLGFDARDRKILYEDLRSERRFDVRDRIILYQRDDLNQYWLLCLEI